MIRTCSSSRNTICLTSLDKAEACWFRRPQTGRHLSAPAEEVQPFFQLPSPCWAFEHGQKCCPRFYSCRTWREHRPSFLFREWDAHYWVNYQTRWWEQKTGGCPDRCRYWPVPWYLVPICLSCTRVYDTRAGFGLPYNRFSALSRETLPAINLPPDGGSTKWPTSPCVLYSNFLFLALRCCSTVYLRQLWGSSTCPITVVLFFNQSII